MRSASQVQILFPAPNYLTITKRTLPFRKINDESLLGNSAEGFFLNPRIGSNGLEEFR